LLVVSAAVLLSTHVLERRIVGLLIPVLPACVNFLDDTFIVTNVTASDESANATLRIQANLTQPVEDGTRGLYPAGWGGRPNRGIQVAYTLGAVVQYSALALIAVLAWPATGLRELLVRGLLFVPIMTLVVLFEVPCTLLAGLWTFVDGELNSHQNRGWIVWGEFLGGGGGLMIALVAAFVCIALASTNRSETGKRR
jgi:hypothetical protein